MPIITITPDESKIKTPKPRKISSPKKQKGDPTIGLPLSEDLVTLVATIKSVINDISKFSFLKQNLIMNLINMSFSINKTTKR
jgi:hypothetical protein